MSIPWSSDLDFTIDKYEEKLPLVLQDTAQHVDDKTPFMDALALEIVTKIMEHHEVSFVYTTLARVSKQFAEAAQNLILTQKWWEYQSRYEYPTTSARKGPSDGDWYTFYRNEHRIADNIERNIYSKTEYKGYQAPITFPVKISNNRDILAEIRKCQIRLIDFSKPGAPEEKFYRIKGVNTLVLSGDILWCSTKKGLIQKWEVKEDKPTLLMSWENGRRSAIRCLRSSQLISSNKNKLKFWNIQTTPPSLERIIHRVQIFHFVEDRCIYTRKKNPSLIRVRDLAKKHFYILRHPKNHVLFKTYGYDNQLVALYLEENSKEPLTVVWNLTTAKITYQMKCIVPTTEKIKHLQVWKSHLYFIDEKYKIIGKQSIEGVLSPRLRPGTCLSSYNGFLFPNGYKIRSLKNNSLKTIGNNSLFNGSIMRVYSSHRIINLYVYGLIEILDFSTTKKNNPCVIL